MLRNDAASVLTHFVYDGTKEKCIKVFNSGSSVFFLHQLSSLLKNLIVKPLCILTNLSENWNALNVSKMFKRKYLFWGQNTYLCFHNFVHVKAHQWTNLAVYPNLNFGQYLTVCARLGRLVLMLTFNEGGLGGGLLWLSLLLCVMVKLRSLFSCRVSLGKKCVETC